MSEENKKPVRLWRYSNATFSEEKFQPYVIAIGEATLSWNDLHECLGVLFSWMIPAVGRSQAFSIWQSSNSDRAKREMLRAALKSLPDLRDDIHPRLEEDITWLLNKCTNTEDSRNNAIHSPLHLLIDIEFARENKLKDEAEFIAASEVFANDWGYNNRAEKMSTKEILQEYVYLGKTTIILRDFSLSISSALGGQGAWPDRPQLPPRPGPNN